MKQIFREVITILEGSLKDSPILRDIRNLDLSFQKILNDEDIKKKSNPLCYSLGGKTELGEGLENNTKEKKIGKKDPKMLT